MTARSAALSAACWALCLVAAAADEPFNPRIVPEDARFAGSAACAQCHREQAQPQKLTPMGRAMAPAAACEILKGHPRLTFRKDGYDWEIVRQGDKSILTVSHGNDKFSVELLYAFGLGKAGQTYVFHHDDSYYESRVSYYDAIGGLDVTMGAQESPPKDLVEAAGRRMDREATRDCFGCHTTAAVRQSSMHMDALVPGVACESCHGPAAQHVAAVKAGKVQEAPMRKLGALATEELSDFCGACHRTWAQIAMNGPRNINNLRFQPYRLTNSKCYDSEDKRIRCVACHNPHEQVRHDSAFYDGKCLACHAAAHVSSVKSCPVAKADCASCHMPKLELPGAHNKFTDHRIRIAKKNEPYPN